MTMDQLVIETSRLRLRRHRLSDLDAVAALWSDPEVVRFIGGVPAPREDSWNRLLRYMGHWAGFGFGFLAVEEKASGTIIGDTGPFYGHRGLGERFDGVPEYGWAFAPQAQGRGYAREAVGAAIDWAAREHGIERSVCMIDPVNERSVAVAEHVGFERFATAEYKGASLWLFER